MSLLVIRKIGDPVLRTQTKEVKKITQKTKELINGMKKTMEINDGIGLAAPQVGISQRIIVLNVAEKMITMINPEIIEQKGNEIGEEGCLSIPEQRGLVKRAKKIKVQGLNLRGKSRIIEADGLLARAFQHEIDHLNGILFVDKLFREDLN